MSRRPIPPLVLSAFLSPQFQTLLSFIISSRRAISGIPPTITAYVQLDDPHSYLLVQALPKLIEKLKQGVLVDVKIVGHADGDHTVGGVRLQSWAAGDAAVVAPALGLRFPRAARVPSGHVVDLAQRVAAALDLSPSPPAKPLSRSTLLSRLATLTTIMAQLWDDDLNSLHALRNTLEAETGPIPLPAVVTSLLSVNAADRRTRGHYNPAMIEFAGQWYWGVDRLEMLYEHLVWWGVAEPSPRTRTGKKRTGETALLPSSLLPVRPWLARFPTASPPLSTLTSPSHPGTGTLPTVELFWNVRSPYAYLLLARFLPSHTRLGPTAPYRLVLRHIPPAVTRGIPIPPTKSRYIVTDCARVGRTFGTPFGTVRDPLDGWERAAALVWEAKTCGETVEYKFVTELMRGMYAEGFAVSDSAALVSLAVRCGVPRGAAESALALLLSTSTSTSPPPAWRLDVESNVRALINECGLWGGPSVRVTDAGGNVVCAVWGQDRMWVVEEAVRWAGAGAGRGARERAVL
ncbi:hypothetical protein HDU93_002945 [Gonapodya sp. JEL0774]|nr:hypothetical protein HDU93_002945 [Gonapodya sp. JEL0774]